MSGYMLDNMGSALNLYFKQIQEKKANEIAKNNDGFEQYKAEKNKISAQTAQTFEKTLESYIKFVNCGCSLLNKLQNNSNSLYLDDGINAKFKEIATVELLSTQIYDKEDKKHGIKVVPNTNSELKADNIVEQNTNLLKVKCQQVYECITQLLLTNIIQQSKVYGSEMFIVALHDFDNILKPTEDLISIIPVVNNLVKKDLFQGKKLKDAMANVCYLTSILFFSKRTDKDINECLTKEYWYDKL